MRQCSVPKYLYLRCFCVVWGIVVYDCVVYGGAKHVGCTVAHYSNFAKSRTSIAIIYAAKAECFFVVHIFVPWLLKQLCYKKMNLSIIFVASTGL